MFTQIHFSLKVSVLSTYCRSSSNFSKSNLKKLLETMPKEPKHIAQAQRQRLKIKEKFQKYVPGKVTLQVLGTGAEGAPKSLYMFTDQSRIKRLYDLEMKNFLIRNAVKNYLFNRSKADVSPPHKASSGQLYLFNCGEGTQRLAHEHKMKLSKLEHIFITHPTWDNIGGLPGLSLTIQDVGVPQITLHGPEGLDELFIATRRFVVLKDLTIKMADCKSSEKFEDNVMTVFYVPITRSECLNNYETNEGQSGNEKGTQIVQETVDVSTSTRSEKSRRNRRSQSCNQTELSDEDDTDYYAHESKRKQRRRTRSRNRCRSVSGTRSTPPSLSPQVALDGREQRTSMCYICRLQPRPGALSLERCVEAGVPPGPLLGQLKAGKDITLDSGVVVKSSDVCLPDDPGPVIIIIDCPSADYLDSLLQNDVFIKHQSSANHDNDLAFIVVHFTPSIVVQDPRYKAWVDKFSPSTQHIVLNDANKCMGSTAVHRIQYKLNMLHTNMFPLLGDTGIDITEENNTITTPPVSKKLKTYNESVQNCETTKLIGNLSMNSRPSSPDNVFVQPNTFCNIFLRPKKGLDRSEELHLVPCQYIEETMSVEGFPEALQHLKKQLATTKQIVANEYPRILFLGTGSCIPNKTRNTSGILVEASDNTSFLMDCGEGTYGQLVRFHGYEKAKHILANLKAVYISHLHADHHIGLIGLFKGRRKAIESLKLPFKPLLLLAPKQILWWLNFYHRRFEEITDDYQLIANGDMVLNDYKLNSQQKLILKNELGMNEVSTVLVRHCPNAFGVAFSHKNGWKMTYSGDTMPCEQLIQLGMNSDILIHEATMEDELAHEAISKMHSTTSQAIEIGQKMKAKHILLTHFSQRYAKLPRFNDNFAENVGIAFDNMQVRLDELPLMPLLYPTLRLMFAEHYEELEHKAVKRQLKQERSSSLERSALK